ncbi:hypothetical protein ACQEVF_41350 [Nonomuraea polychroma]|uniref:hypothetical protein n=1 Tax=Nonomuraea polychroma TaxID=46176 RepID=UPI003D8A4AB4
MREALEFRESTRADEDVLAGWLADEICPMVFTDEGLRAALLRRCRTLKIEPPGRVDRIVRAGRARFEREFCLHVLNGLSADSARSLWELATGEDGFLLELKSDPGRLGLETLLEEIVKLRRAKALGLPADLFGGYSDRLVASWHALDRRARALLADLPAPPVIAAWYADDRVRAWAACAGGVVAAVDGRVRALVEDKARFDAVLAAAGVPARMRIPFALAMAALDVNGPSDRNLKWDAIRWRTHEDEVRR